ncbi:dTDP-4-dehydrorhamnose reductase [Rhodovulum sp. 12E13]|uniref:dTDP-4-dehydrorhamnose reductase n=1 Tax=Rhodovulum sp. 12E13 TaxID=2203891 RepID=UPI000E1AEE6E|nr:dTDP-4-dehydrorhamnose reductase [Rhodovulum sp. 12E13]RDC74045.1 dTDP-4-dehydrorhamnose reductase [Rhodovulum sp. 12E13]
MRLLVIGRTGQVATELAALAPGAMILSRAEADLAHPEAAAEAVAGALAASGADAVVNAAAYTAVDRAEDEAALALAVNGTAPGLIAQACAAARLPMVHISTDYVFDGSTSAPRAPGAPTAPLGAYGRTKLAGEEAVRSAGGVHAILRTSWVFSPHGGNFLKTMLRLSESRDALRIVSDQVGGPTPARAIARACLTIAERLAADPALAGTYHFSGAPDVSWAEFAREIFAQAGRDVTVSDIPTADYPTPAARPLNSRLDCATTQTAFGLERPDWRAGLSETLARLEARS